MNSASENLEDLAERQRVAMDSVRRAVLEFEDAMKALAAANAQLASALNSSRAETGQSDWHQPVVSTLGPGIVTRLQNSTEALRREGALASRIAGVAIAPKPVSGKRQSIGSRRV